MAIAYFGFNQTPIIWKRQIQVSRLSNGINLDYAIECSLPISGLRNVCYVGTQVFQLCFEIYFINNPK